MTVINNTQTSVEFAIDGHFEPLTRDSIPQIVNRISRLRADHNPCFQFRIHAPHIGVSLSTPSCRAWGGGGRAPNRDEESILDLWEAKGLNNHAYTADGAASFAKEMARQFL